MHSELLTHDERVTIMVMRNYKCSARHIARTLYRTASTITHERKRFAFRPDRPAFVPGEGYSYVACAAGVWARRQHFNPPRRSKLAGASVLIGVVLHFLSSRWALSQFASTLKRM
jgi:IS30 family transposase